MHICDQVSAAGDGLVQAVNFNSPGQVVIAGDRNAVTAAMDAMKLAGAKRSLPLPVSAPFHTSMMIPAGEKLEQSLRNVSLSVPEIPVVHNVHAQSETRPERIREILVQQISAPVRWTACIRTLTKSGVAQFAECGAGKVLGGLLRRIDRNLPCAYLESPDELRAAVGSLAR
jgi:[acyl-carrier-protein] S-malonyltransferase